MLRVGWRRNSLIYILYCYLSLSISLVTLIVVIGVVIPVLCNLSTFSVVLLL